VGAGREVRERWSDGRGAAAPHWGSLRAMMLVKVRLGPSAIEGFGVFTQEPIAKGQVVWRFTPGFDLLVPDAELARAPGHVRAFFERYAFELATYPGHQALDGDNGRFMNHCETPCLDLSVPGVGVATRAIRAGEELTCDYALLVADAGEGRTTPDCFWSQRSTFAISASLQPV
jgi:SET domain-containing protein